MVGIREGRFIYLIQEILAKFLTLKFTVLLWSKGIYKYNYIT